MPRGVARGLDELGRITLPKEYRKTMGFADGETVDMFLDGQAIVLRKAVPGFYGIRRNLDHLGRATLPKEFRKSCNMGDREIVDMHIQGSEIYIEREKLQCVFCGRTDERSLVQHNGVHTCGTCLHELFAKAGDKNAKRSL